MPRFAYLFGVVLLWLVAGCGAIWWILTAFGIYEMQWAVLISLVALAPVLFATHIVHRVWRWTWVWSNSGDPAGRRRAPNAVPRGAPPPAPTSSPSSPASSP